MIINLKQTEIEQALRAYVISQGISLHGKDLSIYGMEDYTRIKHVMSYIGE